MAGDNGSDLQRDRPSLENQRNPGQERMAQKCCWKSATHNLDMDCCVSVRPGEATTRLAPHGNHPYTDAYQGREWPANYPPTWRNWDPASETDVCVSLHPQMPGLRDNTHNGTWGALDRSYRDTEDRLCSVGLDTRLDSVHDSGAEFASGILPSLHHSHVNEAAEQSSVVSLERRLTTVSLCDSGVCHSPINPSHRSAHDQLSQQAVFACGTLGPLHSVEQNFSKLCLDSVTPSVDTGHTSALEKQLAAKRQKSSTSRIVPHLQDAFTHRVRSNDLENGTRFDESTESCELYTSLRDQDEDGDTVLHTALILEREDVLVNLMDCVVNANQLNVQNHLGQTVLHLSVLLDLGHLVRRFVIHGAQVSLQDHNGNTPLHIACTSGHIECIIALTQPLSTEETSNARYTPPYHRIPQDPDLRNYEGVTCLHLAARHGYFQVVNYLIQCCGAEPNAREYHAGETVLHRAVQEQNTELVRYLLSFDQVDVNAGRYDNCTPLDLAQGQSDTIIAELLLERGGVSNVLDGDEMQESLAEITMDTQFDYDDFKIAGSLLA